MTKSSAGRGAYSDYGATGNVGAPNVVACGSPGVTPKDAVKGGFAGNVCRSLFRILSPRCEKLFACPRNTFYATVLDAVDIKLGSHNRIMGISNIRIGRSFTALDYLWLHAIESDLVGNNYSPALVIGDNVVFGYFVHIAATRSVCIGNDVLVGSRVIITDHNHGIYKGAGQSNPVDAPTRRPLTPDVQTVVEDNVWIGDGVAILPGSHVGRGSVIGANSVVNGAIPEYCLAAGNPARPIRLYDFETASWGRGKNTDVGNSS
jgi:acetyltransferase-like isoleucine patch superfamily enzyme